jgi:hypothetical protein
MQSSTFSARLAFRSRLIPLSKVPSVSRAVTSAAVGAHSLTVLQSTVNRPVPDKKKKPRRTLPVTTGLLDNDLC